MKVSPDGPGLLVPVVAGRGGQRGGAARGQDHDLGDGPRLHHLQGDAKLTLVGDVGPAHSGVPAEAPALVVRHVLYLAGLDFALAVAQGYAVAHLAVMVEALVAHEVRVQPSLGVLVPLGVYQQAPVEAAEREVLRFQLAQLGLTARENAARHRHL